MSSEESHLHVVVDTNLFVSALISRRGAPYELLQQWRAGRFTLVISEEQRAELAEVVERPQIKDRYRLSDEDISSFLLLLDTIATPAPVLRRLPVHVRDPKDDHLLAAALASRADYLVTGDNDLLALDGNPKLPSLRILTAARFLERLR